MAPPASQGEKIDRLLEAVAGVRATLDGTDAKVDRVVERADDLSERTARSETRLEALENAQGTTARSITNGYRQVMDANSRFEAAVDRKVEDFKRSVDERFRDVEKAAREAAAAGAQTVVPKIVAETTAAAEPFRTKAAKVAKQSWVVGVAIGVFAVWKFFVPDMHAMVSDWHFFVHLVNGTDKLVTPPPG